MFFSSIASLLVREHPDLHFVWKVRCQPAQRGGERVRHRRREVAGVGACQVHVPAIRAGPDPDAPGHAASSALSFPGRVKSGAMATVPNPYQWARPPGFHFARTSARTRSTTARASAWVGKGPAARTIGEAAPRAESSITLA